MVRCFNWDKHNRNRNTKNKPLTTDQEVKINISRNDKQKPGINFLILKRKPVEDPSKISPAPSMQSIKNNLEKVRINKKPVTLPSFKCLENQED